MGFLLQGAKLASVWGICGEQDRKQRPQEGVAGKVQGASDTSGRGGGVGRSDRGFILKAIQKAMIWCSVNPPIFWGTYHKKAETRSGVFYHQGSCILLNRERQTAHWTKIE